MPRGPQPPRLELDRTGKSKSYIIYYREIGHSREKSTGFRDIGPAQEFFARWIGDQGYSESVRNPAEITVAEVVEIYAKEHGPETADPARIAYAGTPLIKHLGSLTLDRITTQVCKRYLKDRKSDKRHPGPGTVRRELGMLRTAMVYCEREGKLTAARFVWLPPRAPAKERWLTRKEAAALLRTARKQPKAKHLVLFILIGLYTGARKDAILSLRWTQNMDGGWVDLRTGQIDFNPVGRVQTRKRRSAIPIPGRLLRFLRHARTKSITDHVIEIRSGKKNKVKGRAARDIKRSFGTACVEAKLENVTPHTLRHTCASWLAQRSTPKGKAAAFLDMSEEIYERTYAKHDPNHFQEVLDAMR